MAIRNRAVLTLACNLPSAIIANRFADLRAGESLALVGCGPTGMMALDLALARPIGLGATVLGTVVFLVGLPFELLAGNVSDPARKLIVEPARFTFTRPLGEEIN
jgi:hypothetical protein